MLVLNVMFVTLHKKKSHSTKVAKINVVNREMKSEQTFEQENSTFFVSLKALLAASRQSNHFYRNQLVDRRWITIVRT